jgi:ATP-dependent DNA ligase
VEAALKNRIKQFVIDGVADFDALHSRKHDAEVPLYAFDILALDGDDLHGLPLHLRKTSLDALREPAAGAYCPTKESFDPLR